MIKPLNNVVVVLDDQPEKISEGGILLPENETPQGSGMVMAIGPRVDGLRVGQRVIFGKLDGHNAFINNKEYLILRDFNIQGVIEDGE